MSPWRRRQAIGERISQLRAEGVGIAIVDAVSNDDLLRLGPALARMPLVTAGSGVAIGLPANFGLAPSNDRERAAGGGRAASGGLGQLLARDQSAGTALHRSGRPALAIDPFRIAAGVNVAAETLAWARALESGPVLVYSTAEPGAVKAVQAARRRGTGGKVEHAVATIARGLVGPACASSSSPAARPRAPACRRWASRGCASAGRSIPACRGAMRRRAVGGGLHIALKSGNFGTDDFFSKAFAVIRKLHD